MAQQKRLQKEAMLSLRRRSVREMSSLSSVESEGEVCVPSTNRRKSLIEQSSYQQGRSNKIEKGSSFDKMTITDYVLQSDIVQTMLLCGGSWREKKKKEKAGKKGGEGEGEEVFKSSFCEFFFSSLFILKKENWK